MLGGYHRDLRSARRRRHLPRHAAPGSGQTDQAGHRAHDGCCSVCSVLQTGAPVDAQIAAIALDGLPSRWPGSILPRLTNARAGSNAQARAPPAIS